MEKERFLQNPLQAIWLLLLSLQKQLVNQQTIIQKTPEKEVLNFKEACDFLGIADNTLYLYCSKRKIPYSKKFGKLYFSREALVAWILKN
ncbi:MAG: helix-turn-helix domain-containing protein [Cyclobacteriaceae bacterium]|nr:helix-turn-helix domain-containing protein [Cyclobacteriaceae bacterium]